MPAAEEISPGDPGGAEARRGVSKTALLLGLGGLVLAVDVATKLWVVQTFPLHQSVPVLGDVVRITYTHNVGAAFGISIGEHSRPFFLTLALVALLVLGYLYRETPATDRLRLTAVALICGGAVGNILDRIRYERGVVDFLDVGLGAHRWYVFNVADMAVSAGAVLLIVSFYQEETRAARHGGEVRETGGDGAEAGEADAGIRAGG